MSAGFPTGVALDTAGALYLTNPNRPIQGQSPQAGASALLAVGAVLAFRRKV